MNTYGDDDDDGCVRAYMPFSEVMSYLLARLLLPSRVSFFSARFV